MGRFSIFYRQHSFGFINVKSRTFSDMKYAVVGATGPTGVHLVQESLNSGHQVIALVRNPDKLQIKHDHLQVEKVDILREEDLVVHMRGCDAVMSGLGTTGGMFFSECTIYTHSIKVIAAAMKQAEVTRFIGITSWGTKYDPALPFVVKYILRHVFLRKVLPDMESMEDYLTDSDLDFTVVRPPQLTNSASTGQEVIAVEGQFVPNAQAKIGRQDLAKFMLKCITDGNWKKKHIAVSVK